MVVDELIDDVVEAALAQLLNQSFFDAVSVDRLRLLFDSCSARLSHSSQDH